MKVKKGQGDPRRVIGYARASTDKQEQSIPTQVAAIEAWCERNNLVLVGVHEDPGVSGRTPLEKRSGLGAAIDRLRVANAGILLVVRRDRVARDVVIAAVVERLVQRAGAKIVTVADGAEGGADTPEANLMRTIVDAFAAYEGALIRERTRAALRHKKAKGEAISSQSPYGWETVNGRYVEVPEEQYAIKRIQQLRDEGRTLRAIVRALEREQVPCRGKAWHLKTVTRILQRAAEKKEG